MDDLNLWIDKINQELKCIYQMKTKFNIYYKKLKNDDGVIGLLSNCDKQFFYELFNYSYVLRIARIIEPLHFETEYSEIKKINKKTNALKEEDNLSVQNFLYKKENDKNNRYIKELNKLYYKIHKYRHKLIAHFTSTERELANVDEILDAIIEITEEINKTIMNKNVKIKSSKAEWNISF